MLNNEPVKRESKTRFLGVIIDDKLSFIPHINNLVNKLRSCTGRICRIRECIPKEIHKEIYHTLFESHLTFAISVWGNVSTNALEPLFIAQKKCIRILFGDKKAYFDKFCNCARSRDLHSQILGPEHYKLESTKPLFKQHSILTVHNLHKYHTVVSTYKIIRTHVPISLYELFKFSGHIETRLKSQYSACTFIDQSTILWNNMREKLAITDFNTTISALKNQTKSYLLQTQHAHDEREWCRLNYTI